MDVEIKLTQYLMPDGRQRENSIEGMPDSLAPILKLISKAGLSLEAEMLTTGEISFTLACHKYAADFDIEICSNGPGEHGTRAALIWLIERFDQNTFKEWIREQKEADDGCGVGWGT
jgi:hypothetical protein